MSQSKTLEAGIQLIGSCLLDNGLIDKAISAGITELHFAEQWQSSMWGKLVKVRATGGVADAQSLALDGVPYADIIRVSDHSITCLHFKKSLESLLWHYSFAKIKSLAQSIVIEQDGEDARKNIANSVQQMQAWTCDHKDTARSCEEIGAEVETWITDLIDGKPDNRIAIEWPIPEMNERFGPIMPHELCCLGARPKMGKAQPLTAKVLTPDGWMLMGDITVGQYVIGLDGKPTRVLGVYPQGKKKIYNVTLTDGCTTQCCEEHLWLTETRNERRKKKGGFSVKSTKEIMETLRRADYPHCPNHVLPWYQPVEFNKLQDELPLDPWLLGVLIGDGALTGQCIRFSKPEKDILEKVASLLPSNDTSTQPTIKGAINIRRKIRNNTKSDTHAIIFGLGLNVRSEFRFIPKPYLRASISDRVRLLQGLVDTDGHASETLIDYSTSSERLKDDVLELCRGLGLGASWVKRTTKFTASDGTRRDGLPSYRIKIKWMHTEIIPFTSKKHIATLSKKHDAPWHRSIDSIKEAGESDCQCISVESDDSIYITDDFIPTHNTATALQIIGHNLKLGRKIAYFTMETSDSATLKMMAAQLARVDLRNIMKEPRDKQQLFLKYVKKLRSAKNLAIFEKDMSISKIEARCRLLKASMQPDLIVLDHLHLIQNDFGDKAYEKTTDTVNRLIELRKNMGCAILLCLQLNRGSEHNERVPRASDARDSGAVEAAAHRMVIPYRPPNDFNDQPQTGPDALMRTAFDYYFIQDICRDGPSGAIKVSFHAAHTIFTSKNG